MAASRQMSSDEQLARELQQQELDQSHEQFVGHPAGTAVGGGAGRVIPAAQVGVPPGSAGAGGPVVYGSAVGPPGYYYPGNAGGGNVVLGSPIGVVGPGARSGEFPGTVVALEVPSLEVIMLRYRISTMCFATIDAVATLFNVITSFVAPSGFVGEDIDGGTADQMSGESAYGPRSLGLLGLVFLIGPICGLVGAKRLFRPLVAVYLFFCFVKMGYQIILVVLAPSLWFVLIAIVQIWVTKIVFTFWRLVGSVGEARCRELLNPSGSLESPPSGGFMFW